MLKQPATGERACRMRVDACALLLYRGEAWETRVNDISASGVLIERPRGFPGGADAQINLEIILDNGGTVAVSGRVARVADRVMGVEFTNIPAWSQAPLWHLLGEYAEQTETLA
jgi:hypothetical protein